MDRKEGTRMVFEGEMDGRKFILRGVLFFDRCNVPRIRGEDGKVYSILGWKPEVSDVRSTKD